MEITDKKLLEILEFCFPSYKKATEKEEMVFMCNVIKQHSRWGVGPYTREEALAAEQRIIDRIYPYYTLYNYLERNRNAPTPFAKAIQFYEDWIEELREET